MLNEKAIIINESDNVFVAVESIACGETVHGVTLLEDVPSGHKVALKDIATGENIIKYGSPIGHATADIKKGSHVHIHNLKTNLKGVLEYSYSPALAEEKASRTDMGFMGYVRKDGKVGVRNEIWIINSVSCVNNTAQLIIKEANKRLGESLAESTDGIFSFSHPYGCSQLGTDHLRTQQTLAGLVNHPNAGGVLVLGLGCENNNIEEFKKIIGSYDENRVKFLVAQDEGDEVEEALKKIEELIAFAGQFKREKVGADKLVIGLKCGGSDGFSGITANPLVGRASDLLVECGGTTILTEVPEMFGAETILMNRCINEEVFNKTVGLINNFKEYFIRYNQEVYENPSPGNKKGGISSLEDKSLGCTQKGGTSNVKDVLDFGQTVTVKGLNLLNGPGNDNVAITNLSAAGAHIVLFTTGRGTPVGAPVPTVKISTNTALAKKKPNWIDYNAGVLLEGETLDKLGMDFFEYILKVASGEKTNNEKNDYRDIAIFKDGVTL